MTDIKYFDDVEVSLIDHMGSDASMVRAARVSVVGDDGQPVVIPQPTLDGPEGKLINYLMRKRHGSPFEHNALTFAIKAPIFVAREFMRHRIGWSYNEMSGRYTELPMEFYLPKDSRPLVNVGTSANPKFVAGKRSQVLAVKGALTNSYEVAAQEYNWLIGQGIGNEVARSVLPVGLMTQFYATCNARSLMSFLALRTTESEATFPSNPQHEIELVARRMEDVFGDLFPVTYDKWNANGRVAP